MVETRGVIRHQDQEHMQGWRIYYGDGTTFDSSMGDWNEAPSTGVQVVTVFEEHPYRMPLYGFDLYVMEGKRAKRGKLLADDDFQVVFDYAMADYDWPGE